MKFLTRTNRLLNKQRSQRHLLALLSEICKSISVDLLAIVLITVLLSDQNIYLNGDTTAENEISQGKLAFVLPGLGAAYPDMLKEMCLHFPEVRAIFDFVDYLAISAGGQLSPSNRIFPRRDLDRSLSNETPASLAMMDSAVVTVLMAEWAIFTLLLNLGITPDMLLGCSTGEFAAITMSGAIDIFGRAAFLSFKYWTQ